jgi:hypothetical protein
LGAIGPARVRPDVVTVIEVAIKREMDLWAVGCSPAGRRPAVAEALLLVRERL